MKKKQANSNWYETFHFYSGHDLTVSVLLNTLGVFNGFAPPYCAAVIVELREKDSDYFVTVSMFYILIFFRKFKRNLFCKASILLIFTICLIGVNI